jgi:hypothetical protein
MVSVMSPLYCKSEWCNRELKGFVEAAEKHGGVRRGTKSRLFKAIKTPVDISAQPIEIQRSLGYEFFEIDEVTQKPHEFLLTGTESTLAAYRRKVDDLAWESRYVVTVGVRSLSSTFFFSVLLFPVPQGSHRSESKFWKHSISIEEP